ncbi:MAG: aminopeptidase [Anaeromicrobium sp.]|uniref:aminopeptidase n=1 Tax=Anaeromicrobium sp. TaxID=1929132 RepID=UPI0025FB358E|nr:aminopeptidase [Anaeromicrobium sp.]MCT4595944.1 aminopeptidase [Anaeromicrobium sp.]
MTLDLGFEFKNGWKCIDEREKEKLEGLNKNYMEFLNNGKTERECVKAIIKSAEENGFVHIDEFLSKRKKLVKGSKIYVNYKEKSAVLMVMGKNPLEKGMNIVASHIDSPRLDLKQYPLYEDGNMALLKTHYYGGIKKYQWTSIPLSLHGIVIKNSGEKIEINIGEDKDDPVFYISDLLPHLSKNQNEKKLAEAITGEGLNIIIGSIPFNEKDMKDPIKYNTLKILKEKYNIEEKDFLTAEIEVVPAIEAREVGLDRSIIGSYGQDDRVCAYTSLRSILEVENPTNMAVALFVDKEEVGSMGNTGMQSKFFENIIGELVALEDDKLIDIKIRKSFGNSKVLSADVGCAFDPNYPDVVDKRNVAYLGKGVLVCKYTGARGKSGSNDASAEFIHQVSKLFDENNIVWQIGELGKVDQGGGGTIAYILANYGAEVIDCGVPLLSMHAPVELASKMDIYMAYKAYKAFLKA